VAAKRKAQGDRQVAKVAHKPIEHRCLHCPATGIYGEGDERWYCREHVPRGFLPHDREATP